jgi:hypothetical protein
MIVFQPPFQSELVQKPLLPIQHYLCAARISGAQGAAASPISMSTG